MSLSDFLSVELNVIEIVNFPDSLGHRFDFRTTVLLTANRKWCVLHHPAWRRGDRLNDCTICDGALRSADGSDGRAMGRSTTPASQQQNFSPPVHVTGRGLRLILQNDGTGQRSTRH